MMMKKSFSSSQSSRIIELQAQPESETVEDVRPKILIAKRNQLNFFFFFL